ncbi:InlB B-repeat-containing protein [uncultured Robinsoniella sp.]|uniref:InlB B-repeat-containing protein n=1 Tax=uncultured Robinsoniella sp. TaxID=904190 RepID=UPI00374F1420
MTKKKGRKVWCKVLSIMMAAALIAEGGSIGAMAAEPGNQVEENTVLETEAMLETETEAVSETEAEALDTEVASEEVLDDLEEMNVVKEASPIQFIDVNLSGREFVTTASVGEAPYYQVFRFTTPENGGGYYTFYTEYITAIIDSYGYLCTETQYEDLCNRIEQQGNYVGAYVPEQCLAFNDDGGSGYNFYINYELEGGTTYYFVGTRYSKNYVGDYKLIFMRDIHVNMDTQGAVSAGTEVLYSKGNLWYPTSDRSGEKVTKIASPTKTGYLFDGYYTEADGRGTQVIDKEGVVLSTLSELSVNATIYAKWSPDPSLKYTATINNGTGDGSYAAGTKVNIKADTPAPGKRFKEWTVNNGGVTLENSKSETTSFSMPANAVTVTATYENIETYKITYNANTISTVTGTPTDTNEYMAGKTATVKVAPTSKSMFFTGWNTAPNGKGTSYAAGQNITINGNVTLYAQWNSTYTDSKSLKYKVTGTKSVSCIGTTNKKAKSVKIPDTITFNGITYRVTRVSAGAFRDNKRLTSVSIGNNVKKLEKLAFFKCINLKKVTIGSGLETIGKHVFCHAKKNCSIVINSTKLKTVRTAMNHGTKNMTVKVPKSKLKTYQKLFAKTSKTLNVKSK